MIKTAERVPKSKHEYNYVFQRCLFAYYEALKHIKGRVLEIGTGSGYGIEIISPKVVEFVTIDKYDCELDFTNYKNVTFIQMEIPPLSHVDSNSFDYVISFQVIEHIENDKEFLKEIYRVLKVGGKLILTTPNHVQSLTRNPWHVREYTVAELKELMESYFAKVTTLGTYGSKIVNDYIDINRKNVQRFTRFDIFDLQHRLPRKWLQIPYDLLNQFNRNQIAENHKDITQNINQDDFYVQEASELCLDLFYIAEK